MQNIEHAEVYKMNMESRLGNEISQRSYLCVHVGSRPRLRDPVGHRY